MSEQITKVLSELGTAFEELKKRQDKIDAQGNNALDAETLARINAAMTNLEGVKSAMEKTETLASQIKDLEEALARKDYSGGSSVTPEAMKHREAFDKFFRKGVEAGLKDLEVQASLSTSSDPDGGFLVPTEYETTIDRIASSVSVFRSMASAINISGDEYKMLMNVGGATAGWVQEKAARAETSTPTLKEITFNTKEIYAFPFATQKTLDDARIDIPGWLGSEVAEVFDEEEADSFINGNGVEKPSGILNQTMVANASYAWGKVGYITSGHATLLNDPDRLITFQNALKPRYQTGAEWLMNTSTQEAIRVLKDGTGNYIWKPGLTEGAPNVLFGKPVRLDDNMPNIGGNAFPVVYGNFKRAYLIVNRTGIRVLRDPFTNKPYVGFYTTRRIGGGVKNYEAYKALKIAA